MSIFFSNTDHLTIPRRFEPLSCSSKRLLVSMKIPNFEKKKNSTGHRHMICIAKTESKSEIGLLQWQ